MCAALIDIVFIVFRGVSAAFPMMGVRGIIRCLRSAEICFFVIGRARRELKSGALAAGRAIRPSRDISLF